MENQYGIISSQKGCRKMRLEEARTFEEPCWNCDECYFYGMDDPKLSQNIVRFECNDFKMSKYYLELNARKQREKIRIVR